MASFTYHMVEVEHMDSITAVAMEMAVGNCTAGIFLYLDGSDGIFC